MKTTVTETIPKVSKVKYTDMKMFKFDRHYASHTFCRPVFPVTVIFTHFHISIHSFAMVCLNCKARIANFTIAL